MDIISASLPFNPQFSQWGSTDEIVIDYISPKFVILDIGALKLADRRGIKALSFPAIAGCCVLSPHAERDAECLPESPGKHPEQLDSA
jgi:hypothetical protein